MRITFLLPKLSRVPSGGHKVAYEYANRLAARGHTVAVVHPRGHEPARGLADTLRARTWPSRTARGGALVPWFEFAPEVRQVLTPDLRACWVPDGDVLVATAWQTAEAAAVYPASKGRQHYLLYDYEFYMSGTGELRRRIADTFRTGSRIISTSPAVDEMLAENGAAPAARIPCGLDLDNYRMVTPLDQRPAGTVGFPWRPGEWKGAQDAYGAVRLLAASGRAGLRFASFGSARPADMPDEVVFTVRPTDAQLRGFYNGLSIFVLPSRYEGWGIPGTEAMACGAALVAADSVGMRDYARDGETALVVPRARPDLLAEAVARLLDDEPLRLRLAEQGHRHVQRYTWDRAVDALERLFQGEEVPAGVSAWHSSARMRAL